MQRAALQACVLVQYVLVAPPLIIEPSSPAAFAAARNILRLATDISSEREINPAADGAISFRRCNMFRWFPRPTVLRHATALVSPQVLAVALAALLLGGSALGALAASDAGGLRSAVSDAVRSNDSDDDDVQDVAVGPTPDGSPDDGDVVNALSETPDSADSTDDTSDVDDSTGDDSEDSADDTSDVDDSTVDDSEDSLDDTSDSPDNSGPGNADSPHSPDDSPDSPDNSGPGNADSPHSPDDSPDSPDDED